MRPISSVSTSITHSTNSSPSSSTTEHNVFVTQHGKRHVSRWTGCARDWWWNWNVRISSSVPYLPVVADEDCSGLMIAKGFAANGAKVYITGRREETLKKAAGSLAGTVIP